MATVALPVVPKYLYRYRPLRPEILGREIEAIEFPYIWCAKFEELNDPMEGYFSPTNRLAKLREVLADIKSGLADVGIGALSDTFKSDLMWAHYASNWTGICIEYEAKKLIEALPQDATIVRMAYNDAPAQLGRQDTKDTITEAVKKAFSQKKDIWAYEREWRVLGSVGKNHIGNMQAVRRVFFGPRICPSHEQQIRTALDRIKIECQSIEVKDYRIIDPDPDSSS